MYTLWTLRSSFITFCQGNPIYCHIRYLDPEDRVFNRVISDFPSGKTTLTISEFIKTGLPVEFEIVRVGSLSTAEISQIARLKKKKISRGNTLIS